MENLLVHVGYAKTGSTWLQKFLWSNAKVGFSHPYTPRALFEALIAPHALDFDADACRDGLSGGIAEARRRGLVPVLSRERLAGCPHSGGYDSKELADRIAAVFPNAKVLIVIREQTEMILSTHHEYVLGGGRASLRDYLTPIQLGDNRYPLFQWNHFEYHRLIRYYLRAFGRSGVLVLPYELFTTQPVEFLSRITRFCDLDLPTRRIEQLPIVTKLKGRLSAPTVGLRRRLNRVLATPSRANPRVLIPLSFPANLRVITHLRKLDKRIPNRLRALSNRKAGTTVATLVGHRYGPSNRITSSLIGVDLGEYGYDTTEA